MYLIVIAWIYVVLMMSVAEATNSNGSILGSLVTFMLYGVGPVALVVYLMGTPARNKAIKQREAQMRADYLAAQRSEHSNEPVQDTAEPLTSLTSLTSFTPDASSHTTSRR